MLRFNPGTLNLGFATFDAARRVASLTNANGSNTRFTYANGNRVTANGAAYVTGPNNQLLFDGTYWYAYDAEGNRTARFIDTNGNGVLDAGDAAVTTYTWDHRNRLTRVTDYATYGDAAVRAVDYLYDGENRWIGRDVDLGANGQVDSRTRFAYDGNQIVLQFDGADMDDPAEPLSVADLSHRYLWNPAAVDQLMADAHVTTPDSPGSILWPLADHLGTIRDLAAYDPATAITTVVNHRTFDAYGNLLSQTNPAHDTLFAFTARPLDQATALQNNLHRWYDAAVGRWMTEDPIGFEGKDANLARYVGNGPVNVSDPNGLTLTIYKFGWHYYPHADKWALLDAGWESLDSWEVSRARRERDIVVHINFLTLSPSSPDTKARYEWLSKLIHSGLGHWLVKAPDAARHCLGKILMKSQEFALQCTYTPPFGPPSRRPIRCNPFCNNDLSRECHSWVRTGWVKDSCEFGLRTP